MVLTGITLPTYSLEPWKLMLELVMEETRIEINLCLHVFSTIRPGAPVAFCSHQPGA